MKEEFVGAVYNRVKYLYIRVKFFLPVLSKLSQTSLVKNVHLSNEWKVVSVAHQRGVYHTPINTEVIFSDMLATESRLNTLY